jgi:integral membrane sensor domain MASE1
VVLLAVIYFLTAQLGQWFALPPGNVTPVWIPPGIILAAVLIRGYYLWPGVFLDAFAGNAWAYFDVSSVQSSLTSLFAGTMNGAGDALCAPVE